MDGQGQQQGGGGQQGGSQQDSGQGQGQGQQGQQQQGQQQGGQQQPNADSIARAARLDGEGEGYAKAARELGVSIDDAKQIIQEHKKRSDAEKSAQDLLTEREGELNTAKTQASEEKKRADRYQKVIQGSVDAQLQLIGDEAIKELLSGMDVAGQFDWLTKHGRKYIQLPEGQQDDQTQQQRQGTPDQFQQLDQLRGPDATRRDKIPGLDDANQQMNDILRERGLSSGVPLQ
jgi:hypothetical protein